MSKATGGKPTLPAVPPKQRGQIQRGLVAMATIDTGDHKALQSGLPPLLTKKDARGK